MCNLNLDIICLIETHLKPNDNLHIDGFQSFVNNRQVSARARRGSGGVAILVKDSIFKLYTINVIDKSHDGILGLEFKHKVLQKTIVIFSCYLPPEGSPWADTTRFYGHLISQHYLNIYADILLFAGDFNARIGNKLDYIDLIDNIPKRNHIDNTINSYCDSFVEFLKDSKLCLINGRITPEVDNFTCLKTNGQSVVDYLITQHNVISKFQQCKVISVNDVINQFNLYNLISDQCKPPDHSIVYTELVIDDHNGEISYSDENMKHEQHNQNPINGDTKRVYKFDSIPVDFMNNDKWSYAINEIIVTLENNIRTKEQLNQIYSNLVSTLTKEMDTFLNSRELGRKQKKKYKHSKPYWTNELTIAWKMMCESEKQFRLAKNKHAKSVLRNRFLNDRHSFDKLLSKTERNYRRNTLLKIENVCQNNPKEFWSKIKNLGPKKDSIPMTVRIDDTLVDDKSAVLEKWKLDFETLYNPTVDGTKDNTFESNINVDKEFLEENAFNNINHELNVSISLKELKVAISKAKTNKATGIDNIPNEVLKNPNVLLVIYKLFDFCFKNCMVPSQWLSSIIKPIPKGSDKDPFTPLNYRGISLISCFSKIYSGLLNSRLNDYLENNNILVDQQNGFRKNRSCEEHIFVLSSAIKNRLNDKKSTFAAFIDLSKAFDSVNREFLFYKLLVNDINGHFYYAVKALYNGTKCCVNINNCNTGWFESFTGVRQGDNLSPTIFNIFLNDLAKGINQLDLGIEFDDFKLSLLLYADDIVLLSDNEVNLQKMLDHLNEWCSKWQMKINLSKSKIVHFRNKRQNGTNFDFKLGNDVIDIVAKYKYLGIIFDEHLTFNECEKVLSDAAGRALSSIISKFKSFKDIGYHTFTKLYETGVLSIMNYGASVWGLNKEKLCQQIQNRAIRYFLGVHKNVASLALQAEMGWLNVKYQFHICAIRLWNRFTQTDNNRLVKKILEYEIKNIGNNWASDLFDVLEMINLEESLFDHKSIDIDLVRTKLFDTMYEHWAENVAFKPKLRYYIQHKQNIETEQYIKKSISRSKRSLLAQLRTGILPLHIETGRYYRTLLENRICRVCKMNNIEDEVHFLCSCTIYNAQREKLYQKISIKIPNVDNLSPLEQFISIMNFDSHIVATYVEEIWNIRKSLL